MLIFRNLRPAQNSPIARTVVAVVSSFVLASLALLSGMPTNKNTTAQATSILVVKPAEISKCTGCHGADLKGRKGFSPGITKSGVLKEYTQKSFETVMKTGITPSGKPVSPPMPVFKDPPKASDALYRYLKTQP